MKGAEALFIWEISEIYMNKLPGESSTAIWFREASIRCAFARKKRTHKGQVLGKF